MNRYVNDNSGYIKICRYICCLYRFNSFVTCDYVSSDTGRQRTVRAVSDVLYIWKFLYYKYCVCSQLLHISGFWALVLFTAVPGILIWSRVNRVSLRELCIKTGIICKKILQGSMGMRGLYTESVTGLRQY